MVDRDISGIVDITFDPQIAPFSGEWNDMEPSFAPDGSWLAFVSNRPAEPGGNPIDAT